MKHIKLFEEFINEQKQYIKNNQIKNNFSRKGAKTQRIRHGILVCAFFPFNLRKTKKTLNSGFRK